MLLPTVFLGLEALVAAVLEAGGLEGVALASCGLERFGVFVSAALLAAGFLAATSDFVADFGVSGFADFDAGEERARGDSAGFLAAVVVDLVTSFFTGVVVLDVGVVEVLPPEGVVEVVLEAAGLEGVVEVFGAAGLDVAVEELLVVLVVGGRLEPVAGRGDADVAAADLLVLETGGLAGAVVLVLVGAEEAGFGAEGFLAAVRVLLVFTPLAVEGGVFFAAVVPVAGFAPLVAGPAPVAFFSPTLLLGAGAVVDPVVFLSGAGAGAGFLSGAVGVFLVTPLVWGLDVPLDRRLCGVLVREPGVGLAGLLVPGLVLGVVLLAVLALESPEVLLLVLAAGVSLALSGWGSSWLISAAGCCVAPSPAGLAAWLGSCPPAGASSFIGLDSNVSIGSIAAVVTPSGFISPWVVVVRLCGEGSVDFDLTGWPLVYRFSGDRSVWSLAVSAESSPATPCVSRTRLNPRVRRKKVELKMKPAEKLEEEPGGRAERRKPS